MADGALHRIGIGQEDQVTVLDGAFVTIEERTDQGLMTEKVRVELRRFFKKRSGRRPLVLPVLMEI